MPLKLIPWHSQQVHPWKLFVLWFDFGRVMTDLSSISWLTVCSGWRAMLNLSLKLLGWTCHYIYNTELLFTLALLSVSQGLSACSPSAASSFVLTNFGTCNNQELWPSNNRSGMNLLCSSEQHTNPSSVIQHEGCLEQNEECFDLFNPLIL